MKYNTVSAAVDQGKSVVFLFFPLQRQERKVEMKVSAECNGK